MGKKLLHTENHCSNIFIALVELGCLASNNKAYLHALTDARSVDVRSFNWLKPCCVVLGMCVCVCVCVCGCVYVWLC